MFTIPPKLKEDIKKQRVVILAGAGVSRYVHYPDWRELIVEIYRRVSEYADQRYESLIEPIRSGALSISNALDTIKQFDPIAREVLKEKFSIVPPSAELYIHKKITNVSRRIITTNYDKLFEIATGIDDICPNYNYELAKLTDYEEYIFKVHGTVDNVADCILFNEDYKRLYGSLNAASTELKSIVLNNTILCIGFSMNDPYVGNIFSTISEIYNKYKRNHYIITTDDQDYSDYNIQPVKLGSYDELENLLDALGAINNEIKKPSRHSHKGGKEYITKRFLRRRCRYSPVGSAKFIEILTELTSSNIGLDAMPDFISKLADLDSAFENIIANAAYNERLGNITGMLDLLEQKRFSGVEESVRLLFLGIAYEKLDRIDEAIDSYQRILAIENDEKLLRSAQFNLNICYEKKQAIDDTCFTRFFESNVTLLGGQRIKDKALTMHIIMCIKEKRQFTYDDILEESLNYEYKVNPPGYVKTLLSFIELKDEELSELELKMIMDILSKDIGVNARVAILKKLNDYLIDSTSEIKKKIGNMLSVFNSIHSDPTVKKYSGD